LFLNTKYWQSYKSP